MPVFVPPVRRGKIIMHLNKLAFGLALGGWACLLAPSVLAESLLELHELAVDSDPQFQADFYGKQATDERYYQARSALLPQINVNVERSEISQDIVSTDNEVYGSGSTSARRRSAPPPARGRWRSVRRGRTAASSTTPYRRGTRRNRALGRR